MLDEDFLRFLEGVVASTRFIYLGKIEQDQT